MRSCAPGSSPSSCPPCSTRRRPAPRPPARTLQVGDASVNTRHHQAIRDVAPALRASAWAEDGVIEGAERQDPGTAWMLAVQWHPEDDVEGALFRGFADAVA